MFDVLLLLAVAGGFLEGTDDEGRCGGDDGDGSLSVLDREFDGHAKPFLRKCQLDVIQWRWRARNRTQSPVAFAISSPTFLGDRPRGPILGARVADDPTSPPVARRWLYSRQSRKFD